MRKMSFKLIALMSLLCTLFSIPVNANASGTEAIILYTNDVHCAVEGYADVAAYKAELEKQGHDVLLVDAGDALQGEMIGSFTQGSAIVDLMNQTGYDYAVVGNHEFDYKVDRLLSLAENDAQYTYLSCNFKDLVKNEIVFDGYDIVELDGEKVAIVGISTPETYTKTSISYFQDENGNMIYSLCENQFYEIIQENIDDAIAHGATRVIAVGHLGIDSITVGWRSIDVIANTTGIDVFIDAHSHETIPSATYQNKDGEDVLLTSTGDKLNNLGVLTLNDKGNEETKLEKVSEITIDNKTYRDVKATIDEYNKELSYLYSEIGESEVYLTVNDVNTQERIVRKKETNMGDFVADAYCAVTGADIGFVNGGGVRAEIKEGKITRMDLMNVNPWGNKMIVIEATGQQIVDALENNSRAYPEDFGGFLQVSGISYEIHSYIDSPITTDAYGIYTGVAEGKERRVKNVKVQGQPIDLNETYTVVSSEYVLANTSENPMFIGTKVVQDDLPTDNEMLVMYFEEHLNGVICEEQYGNPFGDGRIKIVEKKSVNTSDTTNRMLYLLMMCTSGALLIRKRKIMH